METLSHLFQSPRFKRITLVLGVFFLIISVPIALKPDPFLRLGYFGVFIFNLFGPGTIIFPSLVSQFSVIPLSFVTALGMAVNDSISWVVGRSGDIIFPHTKKIERLENGVRKYGFFALFFWSLIPFPYDIIGLLAGYLEYPYPRFLLATFSGRFIRFLLIGFGVTQLLGI